MQANLNFNQVIEIGDPLPARVCLEHFDEVTKGRLLRRACKNAEIGAHIQGESSPMNCLF